MSIGALCYFAGAAALGGLAVWLLLRWRGDARGGRFVAALALTSGWSLLLGLQEQSHPLSTTVIWTAESLRTGVWLLFLLQLLDPERAGAMVPAAVPRLLRRGLWSLVGLQLALVWLEPLLGGEFPFLFGSAPKLIAQVFLALLGLVLLEQYYRNARPELRWRIKFLCFALGAVFAYDFFLYADALLFSRIDANLWAARGAIAVLVTPLLAVAAARNADWSVDIFVSRDVVFHSVTLFGAGIYLLLMAWAGYYIRVYGGEWGAVGQVVFLVGAFLLLALLLLSGQLRTRLRMFFTKNFVVHTYDYRQEWLRIITTLSDTRSGLPLEERVIKVLGEAVESPGGVLWLREPNGALTRRAGLGTPTPVLARIDAGDAMLKSLEQRDALVNLDELATIPEAYEGFQKPEWLERCRDAWLLVPLPYKEEPVFGLLLLTKPSGPVPWNWEVIELIRTSSRLAASYLALEEAGRALAEARQFEGFNRLSAFVIHDLKNLIAQLSLIVGNAERHRHNPEFMSDVIRTVNHAVGKMSRLMAQLKNMGVEQSRAEVELGVLLREVVAARSIQPPLPQLSLAAEPVFTKAHPDRLAAALEHLIHNAQDAAGKHGRVVVRLRPSAPAQVAIEIEDDGAGMDEDFIRTRLFKPFDTTKGLTGMGIGAYESREYLRSIEGDLLVESDPGQGTRITALLPTTLTPPLFTAGEVTTA